MNAQITEKINTKTIQFAWDTQVLYLQIKEYGNNQRSYIIKDVPEDNISYNFVTNVGSSCSTYVVPATGSISVPTTQFSIPTPVGTIDVIYPSNGLKEKIQANKDLINRNIEYLNHIQEIFDYIESLQEIPIKSKDVK